VFTKPIKTGSILAFFMCNHSKVKRSLRASSPFGGYREKYTRESHARGDVISPPLVAHSLVLTRLASLAQIAGLAHRLGETKVALY